MADALESLKRVRQSLERMKEGIWAQREEADRAIFAELSALTDTIEAIDFEIKRVKKEAKDSGKK